MIRHRPLGLGHAYRVEPDQRVPPQPVADQPLELRVTTDLGTTAVSAELIVDGGSAEVHALRPVETAPPSRTSAPPSDGHLAVAADGAPGTRRRSWSLLLQGQPAGATIRYRFTDDQGRRTRWWACTVAAWTAAGGHLEVVGAASARVVRESVRWLRAGAGASRVRVDLALEPGSHVIGFGERFDRVDQAGRQLDATVFEQYRDQGARTYMPVPFAIVVEPSGRAWGFHVRTTARTWYDVGATRPDRIGIEAALDPDDEPRLALATWEGTPADVLGGFLADVGPVAAPPDWVFRPWMSGNEWNTQARVEGEVARSLELGIPVGVVVIEAWSDEATFTIFRDATYEVHPDGAPHRLADFTFPRDGAWPDPAAMVNGLHEAGVRVLLWQVPLQKARTGHAQARADEAAMVRRGFAVRDGAGRPYRNRGWWFPGALLPDWTNPDAAAWWLDKRRYLVEDLGIDGFKTDGGEHAWGDELRYADGSRGVMANNRYPVDYAAAYQRLMRDAGIPPVTFSRAGFTGAGSVPLHWAGDERSTWAAFRASLTAGITAGASGIFFWGWDLGGFSGEVPDAELYLRSAAAAAFSPLMQYHSEFNGHRLPSRDRTPWNIASRSGDPSVIDAYRRLATLRERLVPYLAQQARQAVARSLPLMRAMCFEWPADPTAWEHPLQYLLGDDLLVAPIVEPGVRVAEVYLPAGEWVDVFSGVPLQGGIVVRRETALDELPVYARASAWERVRTIFG